MSAAMAMVEVPEGWMSVSEYLKSSFEPDADYVDGFIEERNLGEKEHSKWQVALVTWFMLHRAELALSVFSELRLQVSASRFRVPDVCAYDAAGEPEAPVPAAPPLVIFEIMSSEDRFGRYLARLQDYEAMGVQNIFVIGNEGNLYQYEGGSLRMVQEESSSLTGSEVRVRWAEIAALRF